jgi:hypothetical protein
VTQPDTLSVEYEELMARADELEAPVPGLPIDNPQAPCALAMIIAAADQLGLSADNMRLYLGVGIDREWPRLAESLRNAAQAYEEADEAAAEAIATDTSVSAVTPAPVAEDAEEVTLGATEVAASSTEEVPYYPVRDAAEDIVEPDQGTGFNQFAEAWAAYQPTLLEARYRFRPFVYWTGESAYVVEQNFDQHRAWLDQMAALCGTMATQAQGVTSVQPWAVVEHPTVEEVAELDEAWIYFSYMAANYPSHAETYQSALDSISSEYAKLQQESEEVLAEYERRAALPLPPVSPPMPPPAYYIPPPEEPGGETAYPGTPSDQMPWEGGLPDPTDAASALYAATSAESAMPTEEVPTESVAGVPNPSTSSGLKPASSGGGGVGGGVPSVPPVPLQLPVGADAGSGPGAPVPVGAGLGRGMPGARGAMGGGGMGMPMGGQGANGQNNGNGKRMQPGDEALYTEKRPWTSAIIGNRRRNDVPDNGTANVA